MIFPNKVINFENSVIGRLGALLNTLRLEDKTVFNLYYTMNENFEDINQFLLAVDVLYLLDAIKFEPQSGVLHYVERTTE